MSCLCSQDKCCAVLCEVPDIIQDGEFVNRAVVPANGELVIYTAVGSIGKGVISLQNRAPFTIKVVIEKTTGTSPVEFTLEPNLSQVLTIDFANTTEIKLDNSMNNTQANVDYHLCVIKN